LLADQSLISVVKPDARIISPLDFEKIPITFTKTLYHHKSLAYIFAANSESLFFNIFHASSSDITNYVTVDFIMALAILATLKLVID